MPELGDYAGTVLGAYGVTLGLLGLLIVVSVRSAAATRRELMRIERRDRRDG